MALIFSANGFVVCGVGAETTGTPGVFGGTTCCGGVGRRTVLVCKDDGDIGRIVLVGPSGVFVGRTGCVIGSGVRVVGVTWGCTVAIG